MYLPRLLFVSLSSSTSRILGLRRAIYGRFLPSRQAFVSAGQHAVSNLSQISVSVSSYLDDESLRWVFPHRWSPSAKCFACDVCSAFWFALSRVVIVPHDDVILIALSVSNLEPNHDPITDDLLL